MSSITDPQAAAQVQGCLKELFKLIKSTDEARKGAEPTLNSISSTHKKIQGEGKLSSSNKSRLKSLYEDAAKEASAINVSNSQHQTALVQQQTRVVPTSVVASSAGHHVLTTSASGHHVLATINQVCKLFPYFIANRNHSIPPTVGRVFFSQNFCGHCYSFLAEMGGHLAAAGLNLLAQLSDRKSPYGV